MRWFFCSFQDSFCRHLGNLWHARRAPSLGFILVKSQDKWIYESNDCNDMKSKAMGCEMVRWFDVNKFRQIQINASKPLKSLTILTIQNHSGPSHGRRIPGRLEIQVSMLSSSLRFFLDKVFYAESAQTANSEVYVLHCMIVIWFYWGFSHLLLMLS